MEENFSISMMVNIYTENALAVILTPFFNESLLGYYVVFHDVSKGRFSSFSGELWVNFHTQKFNYVEEWAKTSLRNMDKSQNVIIHKTVI